MKDTYNKKRRRKKKHATTKGRTRGIDNGENLIVISAEGAGGKVGISVEI